MRCTCTHLLLGIKPCQQLACIGWQDPTLGSFAKQLRHGWAFIQEHADIAFWLRQRQGMLQRHKTSLNITLSLVGKRLQYQDFDNASQPPDFLRGI